MVKTRGAEKAKKQWNRHMRGTESLWFFGEENTRAIRFESNVHFTERGNNYFVFVPIKTVLDLGSSVLGARVTSSDDADPDSTDPPKESKFKDEDVIESVPTDWKMSPKTIANLPKIMVRLENGTSTKVLQIKIEPYRKTTDMWSAHVRKVLSLGSGKSFKPTRQCDIPLKHPLLIQPLDNRKAIIAARFKNITTGQFLGALIDEANKSNAENKQNTDSDDGQWTLKLYDRTDKGYKPISVDPFHFFATWIHEDDWDAYMNMLGKTETTPVRKFISFKDNDACNVLDNLLLKVGERDLKIQGGLTDQEREKYGLDADQGEHDEATADALRGRKIAKAAKDKRLKGLNAQVKGYKFEDGKTVIEVPLGEAKMNAAKGKRPGELTQAAVMGNVSASDIAGPLGWQTTRLASGFFSSEWLHLAAFSWGGFESATAKSGFSTSQNLENLVFGSSETNSLMTRYEMAWQDFYRTEQKLHDHLAAVLEEAQRPVYGRLSIRCNDFSKEICYDFFNDKTKKYDFKYFTMNPAMVEEVKEGAAKNLDSPSPNTMRALYNGERDRSERFYQNLRTNKQEFTTEAEMLFIAHDFPLVVYSIQYTIENGFTSILFNDQAPATFSFYPFQRSLYHQAEAVLDALVWRKIKKAAYAFVGVADELDDVDELEEFRELMHARKDMVRGDSRQKRQNYNYGVACEKLKKRPKEPDEKDDDKLEEEQEAQEAQEQKWQPFTIKRFSNLFNNSSGW